MVGLVQLIAMTERCKVLTVNSYFKLVLLDQNKHVEVLAALKWHVTVTLLMTPRTVRAVGADNYWLTTRIIKSNTQMQWNLIRVLLMTVLQVDDKSAGAVWHMTRHLDQATWRWATVDWCSEWQMRVLHLVVTMVTMTVVATGEQDTVDLHVALNVKTNDVMDWRAVVEVEGVRAVDAYAVTVLLGQDRHLEWLIVVEWKRAVVFFSAPAA